MATPRFRRILVPVDLTGRHRRTVEIAGRLVDRDGGTVHLLHVVEEIPGLQSQEERPFYRRLEAHARQALEELGEVLQAAGVAFVATVDYGSRARQVLSRVQEIRADLIVLTSHRVDPQRRGEGWGTLSYQLGILAPCSVLLVKGETMEGEADR